MKRFIQLITLCCYALHNTMLTNVLGPAIRITGEGEMKNLNEI